MIYSYGVSLPGTYHVKNGIVCQDSHQIMLISKDTAIAAVADGLGSADHSDVGSKIAVSVSTDYCRRHIASSSEDSQILDTIRASFSNALRAIEHEALSKDRAMDLFDTTLSLAVLRRDILYYGHSGDSGVIALNTLGCFEQVTKQQRDEEGRVFPLFFTDKWEFARFEHKVSSVLLATDGMLETFFPIYIKDAPVNIHVSLAQFFMDYKSLRIAKEGQEAIQAKMAEFLDKIPDEQVNDDKTVAVLINTAIKTKRQPEEYYEEPDWAALKKSHDEEWRRAAYPGLYKDNQVSNMSNVHIEQKSDKTCVSQPRRKPLGKPPAPHKPHKQESLNAILLTATVVALLAIVLTAIFLVMEDSEPDEQQQYNTAIIPKESTTHESEQDSESKSTHVTELTTEEKPGTEAKPDPALETIQEPTPEQPTETPRKPTDKYANAEESHDEQIGIDNPPIRISDDGDGLYDDDDDDGDITVEAENDDNINDSNS